MCVLLCMQTKTESCALLMVHRQHAAFTADTHTLSRLLTSLQESLARTTSSSSSPCSENHDSCERHRRSDLDEVDVMEEQQEKVVHVLLLKKFLTEIEEEVRRRNCLTHTFKNFLSP